MLVINIVPAGVYPFMNNDRIAGIRCINSLGKSPERMLRRTVSTKRSRIVPCQVDGLHAVRRIIRANILSQVTVRRSFIICDRSENILGRTAC
ncbi:hypothetical protein D3C71_1590830 [compost metagenome]